VRGDSPATWHSTWALLIALSIGICVPYFALQRVAHGPVQHVPQLPWDAIAFSPGWVWAYSSLYVLFPLAPHLARTRRDLRRFARGIGIQCLVAFPTFLLFPVAGPRPAGPMGGWFYRGLMMADAPTNAFPSLHAAFAVFCAGFAWRVRAPWPTSFASWAAAAALAAWCGAILYATLAIKQHWAVDVVAGVLLGAVAHGLAWWDRPQRS